MLLYSCKEDAFSFNELYVRVKGERRLRRNTFQWFVLIAGIFFNAKRKEICFKLKIFLNRLNYKHFNYSYFNLLRVRYNDIDNLIYIARKLLFKL